MKLDYTVACIYLFIYLSFVTFFVTVLKIILCFMEKQNAVAQNPVMEKDQSNATDKSRSLECVYDL